MIRNYIFVICLSTVFVAGQTSSPTTGSTQPQPPSSSPQDPNAVKARLLLDQMIQALGGQAYLSYQTVEQEGRLYGFSHGRPQGVGAPFWRFWRWPDKERIELTKQRDIIQIYDGDKGWEVTFRGARLLPADQLTDYLLRREYSLERILREWINEPGVILFYAGARVAEQKPADEVTISNTKGQSATIFIDSTSHLPIKKTFVHRNPQFNDRDTEAEIWDGYRNAGGVTTPFNYTRTHNDEIVVQRFLTRVTFNAPVPDSLFVPSKPLIEEKKKKK